MGMYGTLEKDTFQIVSEDIIAAVEGVLAALE